MFTNSFQGPSMINTGTTGSPKRQKVLHAYGAQSKLISNISNSVHIYTIQQNENELEHKQPIDYYMDQAANRNSVATNSRGRTASMRNGTPDSLFNTQQNFFQRYKIKSKHINSAMSSNTQDFDQIVEDLKEQLVIEKNQELMTQPISAYDEVQSRKIMERIKNKAMKNKFESAYIAKLFEINKKILLDQEIKNQQLLSNPFTPKISPSASTATNRHNPITQVQSETGIYSLKPLQIFTNQILNQKMNSGSEVELIIDQAAPLPIEMSKRLNFQHINQTQPSMKEIDDFNSQNDKEKLGSPGIENQENSLLGQPGRQTETRLTFLKRKTLSLFGDELKSPVVVGSSASYFAETPILSHRKPSFHINNKNQNKGHNKNEHSSISSQIIDMCINTGSPLDNTDNNALNTQIRSNQSEITNTNENNFFVSSYQLQTPLSNNLNSTNSNNYTFNNSLERLNENSKDSSLENTQKRNYTERKNKVSEKQGIVKIFSNNPQLKPPYVPEDDQENNDFFNNILCQTGRKVRKTTIKCGFALHNTPANVQPLIKDVDYKIQQRQQPALRHLEDYANNQHSLRLLQKLKVHQQLSQKNNKVILPRFKDTSPESANNILKRTHFNNSNNTNTNSNTNSNYYYNTNNNNYNYNNNINHNKKETTQNEFLELSYRESVQRIDNYNHPVQVYQINNNNHQQQHQQQLQQAQEMSNYSRQTSFIKKISFDKQKSIDDDGSIENGNLKKKFMPYHSQTIKNQNSEAIKQYGYTDSTILKSKITNNSMNTHQSHNSSGDNLNNKINNSNN